MLWDNDIYRKKFGYKIQQGLQLAAMVKPSYGKMLEIGSETGILSYELYKLGYTIEGIEFDYKLVDMARRTIAKSVFFEGDVDDVMLYEDQYPMIIANDAIHKIPRELQPAFLDNVYASMKPAGEWAFEMGAEGNCQIIESALSDAFRSEGLQYRGFYFPSETEYRNLLESAGFEVALMKQFNKEQKISGDDSMSWFIQMFRRSAFAKLDDETVQRIIDNTCEAIKPQLFFRESWTIPYVKIMAKAIKPE